MMEWRLAFFFWWLGKTRHQASRRFLMEVAPKGDGNDRPQSRTKVLASHRYLLSISLLLDCDTFWSLIVLSEHSSASTGKISNYSKRACCCRPPGVRSHAYVFHLHSESSTYPQDVIIAKPDVGTELLSSSQ